MSAELPGLALGLFTASAGAACALCRLASRVSAPAQIVAWKLRMGGSRSKVYGTVSLHLRGGKSKNVGLRTMLLSEMAVHTPAY